ncbi:major facilitator superfamily domain-containing protein [Aspergillus varians]
MAFSTPTENDQQPNHEQQAGRKADGTTTWRSIVWDSWDKPPEVSICDSISEESHFLIEIISKQERRLILKLDLTLLTFGCLGTFIKYLDRFNLTSAFVSGMKEDMELYGNEMNYADTAYAVANIISLWPCILLLTRTNPRWYIPALEIGWTVITFCQSAMTKPIHMYVLRAILGVFETGHFASVMYLCGAWYKKDEMARRMAIINMTTAIGPMFSSYLQSAAYDGLNGVHGRAGWRWLFIIDGVISLGVILPQFLLMPDVPARQKPDRLFTAKEIEMARDRNPKEGRVKQGAFTLQQVKRWFLTIDIWLLWTISFCNLVCQKPSLSMSYWLKAWNTIKPGSYTVAQINNYVTPIQAITVALALPMAWASDTILGGRRWPILVIGSSSAAVVFLTLGSTPVFPENRAGRWTLYYLTGFCQASSAMFWAWTQDTLIGDPATRAFAGAGLNVWAYVADATIPLGLFKTVDQPGVVVGNYGAAGFALLHSLSALTLAYLQHRRRKQSPGETLEESEENQVLEGEVYPKLSSYCLLIEPSKDLNCSRGGT